MIWNNNTKRPQTDNTNGNNIPFKLQKGLDIPNNKTKLGVVREFGREISTISITNNINKQRNKSNKGVRKNFTKAEVPLYNLRPRTVSNNSFNIGVPQQGHVNSSFNNENNNTMNLESTNDRMDVDTFPNVTTAPYVGGKIPIANYNKNKINLIFPIKKNIPLFNHIDCNKDKSVFNPPVLTDPQICYDYAHDIYNHLKATETIFQPQDYMQRQKDINEKMRAILIDWIVDVHLKFKLVPETLFLTVNIIDRYLEKNVINRSKLQLVGVAGLFIACKYEEIYPPELKDFVYVTDKAYSKNEILIMENDILNCLGFNITTPSSLRFLELYFEILGIKFEEKLFFFSRYILELVLCDYRMLKYSTSLLAATSLFIANRIYKVLDNSKINSLTGYTDEKLKEYGKDICILLDNAEVSHLKAIKTKFSSEKFLEVARWNK